MKRFLPFLVLGALFWVSGIAVPNLSAQPAGGAAASSSSPDAGKIDEKSSKEFEAAKQQFQKAVADAREAAAKTEKSEKPAIVNYVRGKEGIPFVEYKAEIKEAEISPVIEETPEKKKLRTEMAMKALQHQMKQMMTARKLPRCVKSSTVIKKNPDSMPGDATAIIFDMIFVKQDVQVDLIKRAQELFGKTALVRPYTTIPGDAFSVSAAENGLFCLPTRIRVTPKYIYIHTGRDALKKYEVPDDKAKADAGSKKNAPAVYDPSKGTLDPAIERQLNEFW